MKVYVKSKNVLIDHVFKPATIHLSRGRIASILPYDTPADYDYEGCYVVPGFVDLHLHGGYGIDVLDEDEDSFRQLQQRLLQEGTTSFLATSTTLETEMLKKALMHLGKKIETQIAGSGATCLGIHLEGPFLNPDFAGAQKVHDILKPSISLFEAFQSASGDKIKRVTLAPETDVNNMLTTHLSNQGILVSVGHSGATAEETHAAITAGAKLVTHLFNGMPQLHHREIGLNGMAMLSDQLVCEVIADGNHINFNTIELVRKTKGPGGIVLVTDANKVKGLAPGEYTLHGRNVVLNERGEARIKESGSLAGSTSKMNIAIKNIIENTTIDQVEAFQMASLYPAKLLNIDHIKGRIDIGHDADIAILDQAYQIVDIYVAGQRKGREK